MSAWTPDSWRRGEFDLRQQPEWPDAAALEDTLKWLRAQPPLIYAGEARMLKDALAGASRGEALVLQAGDCAETFQEFSADRVKYGLKVVLQMAIALTYSSGVPMVKIGRVAGQFAKPRSAATEMVGDEELPVYRGDMVNRVHPDQASRTPDPRNIRLAYEQAVMTLNLLRGFARGGFADLSEVHNWNREFLASTAEGQRYEEMAEGVDRALRFMRACGVDTPSMHQVDIYSSHEALVLAYEEALTRQDSTHHDDWYDCSAHMLWIGARTVEQPNSAHVEFLRGVGNPIGVKVSPRPKMTPERLVEVCGVLDPDRQPGRLTLISRMGSGRVRDELPDFVRAVAAAGHPVVWICDPMHGNTFATASGLKTRNFDAILDEISGYFDVHRALGTWPGGIHLELTGDDVTECIGGSDDLVEADLHAQYNTACDPRLNARQSLDLAFRVSELLEARGR